MTKITFGTDGWRGIRAAADRQRIENGGAPMNWSVTALVKDPTTLVIYWRPVHKGNELPGAAHLRITDLTGRAPSESLDGQGQRLIPLHPNQTIHHAGSLLPDRLYGVELGHVSEGQFHPIAASPPVQTPWDHASGSTGILEPIVPGSRS